MADMDEKERIRRIEASRAGRKAAASGDPSSWFDHVYKAARKTDAPEDVPWVDLQPHRLFLEWLERENPAPCRVCVVGSGLGEDAEELARRGFEVTAFDVSPTAVDWCRERYPDSTVDYRTADLFDLPKEWFGVFELVVEVYTVQALPLAVREESSAAVASLTAPGGRLLVVSRARPDDESDPKGPPWPLSRLETTGFLVDGMNEESFETVTDADERAMVRFRVVYRRSADA